MLKKLVAIHKRHRKAGAAAVLIILLCLNSCGYPHGTGDDGSQTAETAASISEMQDENGDGGEAERAAVENSTEPDGIPDETIIDNAGGEENNDIPADPPGDNDAAAGGSDEQNDSTKGPADATGKQTKSTGMQTDAPEEAAGGNEAPSETLSILMVGDMLMHSKVVRSGLREDGTYSYDHLFANVADEIKAADIAIVNQETIMGGEELGGFTGYPAFNSPYELADAEVKAGFDVVLHGTNHALDRHAKGIENCLANWETKYPGIHVLGIHDSADDRDELCIIEKNGIRVAILNYTYGTNGIQMPEGKGYLVDYLDERRVRADIERAEAEADLTVVCPHWGDEYSLAVSSYQKKWTGIFLETGVDLVIGTHPHVIEPVELLTDEEGREMLVYYSLGNFVNTTSGVGEGVMNRMVGGMAEIVVGKHEKSPGMSAGEEKDADICIENYGIIPLVNHITDDSVTAYFLSDYTEEMAQENRAIRNDPSFSLEACEALVDRVWPGLEGDITVD